jgi:RimK-like ATP-grasp domain
MILLWGIAEERPLAAVHQALVQLAAPVVCLDQRHVLHTEVVLTVDSDVRGQVRARDLAIDLHAVSAVYMRPYDWRQLPGITQTGPESPAWQHALHVEDTLASWLDLTPALVVNRAVAAASNGSKPYQARQIQAMGFAIPDTLITTDPAAAREFWEHHRTVIYKSVSGIRSIVSRLTPAHASRLERVAWCPTQFQEYIPGHDVRVHVVGGEVFACEIHSEADDYRYAGRQGATVQMRPCSLPADCAERCWRLAVALGLVVAGIDLRRTPDGRWYCFEVNPSPGFTYYQQQTNLPIAEAIARLLVARSLVCCSSITS